MAHLPACLEGLLFESGSGERTETRSGVPIYNGNAGGFSEWQFKVTTRMNACEAEKDEAARTQKVVELSSKIVDALTDEALKVAMDLGTEKVLMPGFVIRRARAIIHVPLWFWEFVSGP